MIRSIHIYEEEIVSLQECSIKDVLKEEEHPKSDQLWTASNECVSAS